MIEVKLKNRGKSIPVEKALKILKKKMDKEGVMDELKKRKEFVSESEKKRQMKKRKEHVSKK